MKWNARLCTTDPKKIIESDEVNLVVISTPHNLHAELVLEALKHEKAVFVEKPLAMNKKELRQIIDAYEETKGFIMVGFNRRYSPIIERTKDYLSKCYGPKIIDYEVHVESLPANNWINDPEIGGGRILGEACHFFDLFRYLIEAKWKDVFSKYIPVRVTQGSSGEDFIVSINWEDGSASTLKYTTMGSKNLPKETITIHCEDLTIIIKDFKEMIVDTGKVDTIKFRKQEKGHLQELQKLVRTLLTGENLVQRFQDAVESMMLTFDIMKAISDI